MDVISQSLAASPWLEVELKLVHFDNRLWLLRILSFSLPSSRTLRFRWRLEVVTSRTPSAIDAHSLDSARVDRSLTLFAEVSYPGIVVDDRRGAICKLIARALWLVVGRRFGALRRCCGERILIVITRSRVRFVVHHTQKTRRVALLALPCSPVGWVFFARHCYWQYIRNMTVDVVLQSGGFIRG